MSESAGTGQEKEEKEQTTKSWEAHTYLEIQDDEDAEDYYQLDFSEIETVFRAALVNTDVADPKYPLKKLLAERFQLDNPGETPAAIQAVRDFLTSVGKELEDLRLQATKSLAGEAQLLRYEPGGKQAWYENIQLIFELLRIWETNRKLGGPPHLARVDFFHRLDRELLLQTMPTWELWEDWLFGLDKEVYLNDTKHGPTNELVIALVTSLEPETLDHIDTDVAQAVIAFLETHPGKNPIRRINHITMAGYYPLDHNNYATLCEVCQGVAETLGEDQISKVLETETGSFFPSISEIEIIEAFQHYFELFFRRPENPNPNIHQPSFQI